MLMMEFAEYLPIVSYYFIFNKTSPFMLITPIACIFLLPEGSTARRPLCYLRDSHHRGKHLYTYIMS